MSIEPEPSYEPIAEEHFQESISKESKLSNEIEVIQRESIGMNQRLHMTPLKTCEPSLISDDDLPSDNEFPEKSHTVKLTSKNATKMKNLFGSGKTEVPE